MLKFFFQNTTENDWHLTDMTMVHTDFYRELLYQLRFFMYV